MKPSHIDRLEPTRRPVGPNAGTQRWESLLFCHWEVPAEAIRLILPEGMELDTFEETAYVGIVPFKMRAVRPRWLPHRFAFNFLETNVRTYVVHQGRPGVYFFSLDANSRLAVIAARLGWALPYFYASMQNSEANDRIQYSSERAGGRAKHEVTFRIGERLGASVPNTLEHFLLERYLLFVEKSNTIYSGQVSHQPYEAWTASVDSINVDLIAAAGFSNLDVQPNLAHYSPGVDVEVFAIKPTLLRPEASRP